MIYDCPDTRTGPPTGYVLRRYISFRLWPWTRWLIIGVALWDHDPFDLVKLRRWVQRCVAQSKGKEP